MWATLSPPFFGSMATLARLDVLGHDLNSTGRTRASRREIKARGNHPLGHDLSDARECFLSGRRHRQPMPSLGFEVIERQGAWARRATDDQPADHARLLVWHTVVVVDSLDGERHLEMLSRLQEPGVPGLRRHWDALRVIGVARTVRGRRVNVRIAYPAYGGARLEEHAHRVESHHRAVGVAPHMDLEDARGRLSGPCFPNDGAEHESARGLEYRSACQHGVTQPRRSPDDHFATRASSALVMCHRMMW